MVSSPHLGAPTPRLLATLVEKYRARHALTTPSHEEKLKKRKWVNIDTDLDAHTLMMKRPTHVWRTCEKNRTEASVRQLFHAATELQGQKL